MGLSGEPPQSDLPQSGSPSPVRERGPGGEDSKRRTFRLAGRLETLPPLSTYRLQLRPGFGFDEAAAIADYLAGLGITHLYCSPYLQAAKGSAHGYDVIDPTRVNEELGGEEAHARFCRTLGEHGLGQVLDIVPNHMAITERRNVWWWDVLENGPSSVYASYFDVDWDPPQARLRNTVLLPILGDHYGRVLEAGELRLVRRGGKFEIHYHEHHMPVAPRSLDTQLGEAVEEVNADPDRLDELLSRQYYRPAFWRVAGQELNYRRFFDVHTLVGLRTEDERVFADTHVRVLQWLREGVLDGVRVDHPDGLRDPQGYLQRLRAEAPDAWIGVEKILEPGETLRDQWPVDGTTGYDFLNLAGGLFVDRAGERPLTELYAEITGESTDWSALVREKKLQVLSELLASDVNRLAEVFSQVCERHRRHRDYTRFELRQAIREGVACFPVYRTYVRAEAGEVSAEDERWIDEAMARARGHRPDLPADLLDFFRDLLLLKIRGEVESELVMRFQQLTGPAMAKGVEDTAFYNYHRLVSLNEVGGSPGIFGTCVAEFHRACAEAWRRWPRTMLATSTHDTKRSEDVRARISLLSEMPERWGEAVRRWCERNERHRRGGWPDRNAEYLLYQTLVGAWPISAERAAAYMEKAAREAKVQTAWARVNPEYEEALRSFVHQILEDRDFVADLEAFVAPLVAPGRITSLAQTLLKLTAPGVPDFYQGTELWDLSLVDPDNRRPVDYDSRRRLLAELEQDSSPEAILARMEEGLPKLWLIRQGLHLRRRRPEAFGPEAEYEPLAPQGQRAENVVAFLRGGEVAVVVPRLVLGLAGEWGDTTLELPEGRWRNELTGEEVAGGPHRIGALLARFPVALLARS